VYRAADAKSAIAALADTNTTPHGLLVDYHLDDGNGIDAIVQLRWRFGSDLPAILITADRSPHVRQDAQRRSIQVLHKPVKPAALRALIAQWRAHRVAAE
jgi:CheY-like chemotaxis protein